MRCFSIIMIPALFILSCNPTRDIAEKPVQISGIYPHLAFYNQHGECGTGAIVPWADRLWVVTYSPHFPNGSTDKLYAIDTNLEQAVSNQSIGGTPANRMIHQESNQLFLGPYAIDANGVVRVIPYSEMQGRHTGNARHLTRPAEKIYYGTMEEGFYEVDVRSLEVIRLYQDGNQGVERADRLPADARSQSANLPGAHGKGLYSGQGVLVYSNNGEATPEAMEQFDIESGALAEWDGKNWKLIRRNQFVEVTGPGGIYGNKSPQTDPIWTTGWDHKSTLVGVRSPAGWRFYRLPKASHSYDGAHGWNTEWPRIRNVGTPEKPDYLMTMHGMFWRFPETFTAENSAGIRPRSSYLKVIGDFTRWNGQLVFGCDDSAQKEFLNKRKQKGGIEGPGQSNSNLWFTSFEKPDALGPKTAVGSVWLNEEIRPGEYSEPFLFTGWPHRTGWIQNAGTTSVELFFELDRNGDGKWKEFKSVLIPANGTARVSFPDHERGEWIRARTKAAAKLTLTFTYSAKEDRTYNPDPMFNGLASIGESTVLNGLLYGLGDDRRTLGVSTGTGYYELNQQLGLEPKDDEKTNSFIQEKFAIPEQVVSIENSSVLVVDDRGRRWRLPLGHSSFTQLTDDGQLRVCREVATERDLFNCHGTFYELPAENADGFAKLRPISSHNFRVHDYASYRGMLVMTGILPEAADNPHIIRSPDGKAAVWVGVIDDLWNLGKPTGQGGPWKDTPIAANEPSDPYLIGFYDQRNLVISHNLDESVQFKIEVEPTGHGPWMLYEEVVVAAGDSFAHEFPEDFQARWIRFSGNKSCRATTWLTYR